MLLDRFKTAASPLCFLMGSLATVASAPNKLVMAGGVGLSLAAAIGTISSQHPKFGEKYGRLLPAFALAANVPLTSNGINMVHDGVISGKMALVSAGGLLAIANGAFYASANIKGFFNQIAPDTHAHLCMAAGTTIGAAGILLRDPLLTTIGASFVTEALLRTSPVSVPQALRA